MATRRRSDDGAKQTGPPPLPPEAHEILELVGTRSTIIGEKFHRVWMSTFDAKQRLFDLSINDDDLDSLLTIMRIDLDDIKEDLIRIAMLGKKLRETTGAGWLRRQLEGLGKGGG